MNTAGVDPCPNCGAPLIPGVKCPSCNYNPAATTCQRCGTRFDGDKCGICGWSGKAPLCRYCGADLTDDHIVLKQQTDDWVWKCCAYCGAPIEQYLYTILGEIEPYSKPYDSDDYGHGSGVFGVVIMAVLAIFIVAALIVPLSQLTTGIVANHTGFTPNANITIGNSGKSLMPILQLFPLIFVFLGLIVIVKVVSKY